MMEKTDNLEEQRPDLVKSPVKPPEKILAIDTSSVAGSIALIQDGSVTDELTVGKAGRHSEWLLPAIEEFLKGCKLDISEVDLFAAGNGPGSFTGLRIGVSTLKGLAWALSRPVIGVSTLEALAMNIKGQDALICPVFDARKGQVYTAFFILKHGCLERVTPDVAVNPEEISGLLAGTGLLGESVPLIFIGHGLSVYGELIKAEIDGSSFAEEGLWDVSAGNIGLLASSKFGEAVTPVELLPTYRRPSEAEFKRNSR
ncbi:tRNA threonylcarbamoyladenosine biosynthesis protein TsaB [hydrothermal vent metagenome]|uniref:tRNA threonylcarbamoyladenosine biosynthesis protein TsaB n=1 Tax=hydrothermal vent metagenome TaxID=652676 RepID=A0A3B0QSL0_9ZZZZ